MNMKQRFYIKSLLIAMLVLFGGGVYAQQTKTLKFEVTSTSTVTLKSGTLPNDVTVSYSSTYSSKCQLTGGNSMTLTLSDFPFTVSSVTLDLKTNKSSGQGNLTVKHNDNTIHSTTPLTPTPVSFSTSYSEYTFNANDTQTSGDLVITLAATANSIYCDAFTITYVDNTSATGTTDPENSFANADEDATVGEDYTIQELSTLNTTGLKRYGSSDETVAEVDGNGNVTLKKYGETTITVTTLADDTYREGFASYTLHVAKGTPVLSFASETVTAYLGTEQYGPALTNPGDGVPTYTIDPDIATIQSNGYIQPKATGTATVTVTTSETDAWKSATASYTLVVKEPFSVDAVGNYTLVTEVSTLKDGDQILISYNATDMGYVLGEKQTNNFNATSLNSGDLSTDKITLKVTSGNNVTAAILEGSSSGWYFHTNGGYLCATSSSKNNLETVSSQKDNAKASINISNAGDATIIFSGSYTHNLLKYNSSSTLFSCYASSSDMKLVQLYRKVPSNVPPTVTFSPASGTEVNYGTQVTISARTATSITYRVNDGEAVTVEGTSATVTINTHSTIKATATNQYGTSEETTAEYTIHAESPAFTYDPAEYTITFGDEFKAPELGKADGYDGTVTFASDNTAVAEVDAETGDVTVKGAGTAVIIATGTATEHFEAATAFYTLTVNKQASAVSFAEPVVEITYGDNYDKQKATAEGFSGDLVYSSSNVSVVKFHGNGVIDVLGPGTVTITATAPATETTEESSATYTLKIYEPADAVEGAALSLDEHFDDCESTRPAEDLGDKGWNGTNQFKALPETCNWTVVGTASPAGNGCLKLGTSTAAGDATSPSFTLNGKAPLAFDIAPWTSSSDGSITGSKSVTVTLTNATFEDGSTTKTVGDPFTIGWNHFEYDVTGSGDVTINFHGGSQFFLDNVVVGGGAQPAHEINLTFSSAGYLTWVATADIDFSQTEGVTAYQITEATSKKITMVEVDKVPAGAAVMLKGSDTKTLKRTTEEVADLSDNKMKACTDGLVTGNGNGVTNTDVYVLGNGKSGLGFYMLKGTLQAGKGYLQVSEGTGNAKPNFISFEETTGVKTVVINKDSDGVVYNLQGIRVAHPQKGIYVKNGKKYVIK